MTPTMTGPLAALVAGLVTSLHCVGMCGPLACSTCVRSHGAGSLSASAFYHGARMISYGMLGLLAGWMGRAVSDILLLGTARWITWAFVGFFVVVATGLDKRLRIPLTGEWMAKCLGSQDSAPVRSAILGTLTPFIPCGPLYLIVAAAALSGSAFTGMLVLVAFCLGTIPLMFALQSQYFRLGKKLSPLALDRIRRVLAVVSVGVLLYRGSGDPSQLCR